MRDNEIENSQNAHYKAIHSLQNYCLIPTAVITDSDLVQNHQQQQLMKMKT